MISATIGSLILLVLLIDVYGTVFDVQGRGGLLNKRHNRLIWSVFRRWVPDSRSSWLNLAAPFMICLTLVGWVLLLILGFALIYLPWMETFIFASGALRSPWLEAIYYSGYIGATLGLGDVVPDEPLFRLLAPVQALAGFALVSISVTYLLATYSQIIPKRAVADRIAGFLEAWNFAQGNHSAGDLDAMDRWAEEVASKLLIVLESHFQYPVLNYFRSDDDKSALPIQVEHLDRCRRNAEPVAWSSRLPLRSLSNALDDLVLSLDEHFVPDRFEKSDTAKGQVTASIDRLLRYLRYR